MSNVIKVASTLPNAVIFSLTDEKIAVISADKNTNPVEAMRGIPVKKITIVGKNHNTLGNGNAALTMIDSADWEAVKKQWAHAPEIKRGHIFAEKNDLNTMAKTGDVSILEKMHGLEQETPASLKRRGEALARATGGLHYQNITAPTPVQTVG